MKIDSDAVRIKSLRPYIALIENLVDDEIGLDKFKKQYFEMFKADDTMWAEPEYNVLNDLFLDLDEYNVDPSLRDPGELDDAQMIRKISHALESLKSHQRELDQLHNNRGSHVRPLQGRE